MSQPASPPPSRLPPPSSRKPPAPRGLNLVHVVVAAGVLLVAGYFIGGKREEARPQAQAVPAVATRPDTATPAGQDGSGVMVMRGQAATERREVDLARMTLLEGGTVLRIEGGVGRHFARQLAGLLAENRGLQRIDITSGGGYMMEGFEAARVINRHNLIVRAKSHCASICVALWAAAFSRQLEPDAVIGLHQWTAQCEVMPSPEREQCQHHAQFATNNKSTYEAWLRSAGFNANLIALQARTLPQDMAILTAAQLRSNGVDFVLVDKAD
ncbi:hypothetical protein [Stenotrophomonas ginsengisoli]|uniref:hypothetical protein n=1 Tax=Stenotrophomonas ginsengisoli TaxID=336566 RepID=UPI00128F2359|nr:hypothetical protein [Stenotrophomonas ginsengisoli]